jgi:O-antigen/teichoic acid export membrane protein
MGDGVQQKGLEAGLVGKSSTLMLATVLANGFSLIGYALLPRVFAVDIIGEYFAVLAIGNVISVFVHLGLVQAVPLMNDTELGQGTTLLTGISLIVILSGFVSAAGNGHVALVLLAAGILSLVTLIEVVLIREGRVGGIALFRLMTPIFSFTCALLLGLLFQGSLEMIVGGYLLGLAAIVLIGSAILIIPLMVAISVADVRELSQSYSRFLQYIGPGLLFHTAAYNLPSVVGLSFFGGSVVAAYNLAYKFVLAPMTIVGKAISQAYISNLSSAYRSDREFSFAKRVDMVLFGLALSAAAGIYYVFPWVASLLFPETHQQVAAYAIALIPLVIAMLTVSPLSNILQFTNNQKKIFHLHVLSFLLSLAAFGLAVYVNNFLVGVGTFSVLILLRYAWLYREIVRARRA